MPNWANGEDDNNNDDDDDTNVSNNALLSGHAVTFTKCFHNCLILALV